MADLVEVFLRGVFVNNPVLVMFLGLCPFIGVSRWTRGAVGMAKAVVFVMTVSTPVTWAIYRYLLVPLDAEHLWIVTFVLVIASLVQFLEGQIKRRSPSLQKSLGIYLTLIASNCAILGVALLDITFGYSGVETVVYGFSGGIGYSMVLLVMTGIREQLETAEVPRAFRGAPIAFVIAAILSMAFTHYFGVFGV